MEKAKNFQWLVNWTLEQNGCHADLVAVVPSKFILDGYQVCKPHIECNISRDIVDKIRRRLAQVV